jgi:hypothetical protein
MPKFLKVKEVTGTKKCQATIRRTRILAEPVTIKVGLTKIRIQAKPLKNSKKTISYQFRADAPTYCHQPQCKAANRPVRSKTPNICLLLAAAFNDVGNKILLRINWR